MIRPDALRSALKAQIDLQCHWRTFTAKERAAYAVANEYSTLANVRARNRDMYYIDENGKKQDAEIHEGILRDAEGDSEETATWWDDLNREQQRDYIKAHAKTRECAAAMTQKARESSKAANAASKALFRN